MKRSAATSPRRSKRTRSVNQLLIPKKVPSNGHCLYIAVLEASKNKGLNPGNTLENVDALRGNILEEMNKEKATEIKELLSEMNELEMVKKRISEGIGKRTVGKDLWAGQQEIQIMKAIYDLNITLYRKDDALSGKFEPVYGTDEVNEKGIILTYINGNHYEWAEPRDWSEFLKAVNKKTKSLKSLKF